MFQRTFHAPSGDEQFDHYRHTLEVLGNQKGLVGLILNKSQNKFDSRHPSRSPCQQVSRIPTHSRQVCQYPINLYRLLADLLEKEIWSEKSPDGPCRTYNFDELINRDKASLDNFWLKDESLEDTENLPAPDVQAQEIVEQLEAALEQFREIAEDLGEQASQETTQ